MPFLALRSSASAAVTWLRGTAGLAVIAALALITAVLIVGVKSMPASPDQFLGRYLAIHMFFDVASVVVSSIIFLVGRSSAGGYQARNTAIMAVAFLAVALFDFQHLMSYPGMPDFFTASGSAKAVLFWLLARLIVSAALLGTAVTSWERRISRRDVNTWTAVTVTLVVIVSAVCLYAWQSIATWIVDGDRLGVLSHLTQLVIVLLATAAMIGFYRQYRHDRGHHANHSRYKPLLLLAACVGVILTEILLALSSHGTGVYGILSHLYKVATAWLVYFGIAALKQDEEVTQLMLARESAGIALFDIELTTGRGSWQSEFSRTLGLPPDAPHDYASIIARIHPEDRPHFERRQAKRFARGGKFFDELRIVTASGDTRWISLRGEISLDDNRQPVHIMGAAADVTARKQAEVAVRQSEARLSGILSTAADAIISIDEDQRVTLFNRGAETIFGYDSSEVIGQPLDMLIPDRVRKQHSQHVRRFSTSDSEARLMGERQAIFGRHKSGREFPAEASISKISIAGRWTYSVVLRDVSDRKAAEAAVLSSEARLRLTLEAGRMGAWEWDLPRGEMTWDATLKQIMGVEPDATVVPADTFMKLVHPEDAPAFREAIEQSKTTGQLLSHEFRIARPDGRLRWLAIRGFVTSDNSGKPVHMAGINFDITESKNRQDELEARVAERTRELQQEISRREATQAALMQAQRMDALGQLTGGIAHDSNNLLTVITGNLEMLEDDLQDHPSLKYVYEAQEAAAMGARLNQRLLTFARRRKLEAQVINLNDQVLSMSELLRRTLGENINLTTVLMHDLWSTRVDPSEVENAVLNLAINARDAMPNGGRLLMETSNIHVGPEQLDAVEGLEPGDYVRLSVSDNGTGMSREVLRRVFEPFFTTKGPGKGTGLGLSSLYGFARQSAGHVTIYSELGRGTTVNLYLPRVKSDGQTASPTVGRRALAQARGETILVVEDNPQVRSLTLERLRRLGYGVVEADSGPKAMEIMANDPGVDLVFSDVVMPGGMSGFDIVRALRAKRPDQRILLTSGFSEAVAREGDSELDVEILRKPYSLEELSFALRRILDQEAAAPGI